MPAKKAVKKKATKKVDNQEEELAKLGITPEIVSEALKELITESQADAKSIDPAVVRVQREDEALVATVSEFLNNFMLIGFRLDGKPITIRKAKTIEGNEALKSLLLQFTRVIFNG